MVSVSVVQVSCGVVWVWGVSVQPVKTKIARRSKGSFFMGKFFIFKTNISDSTMDERIDFLGKDKLTIN